MRYTRSAKYDIRLAEQCRNYNYHQTCSLNNVSVLRSTRRIGMTYFDTEMVDVVKRT